MIISFKDEYRWLSNFWYCPVRIYGDSYTSVEAAYVAAKTLNEKKRAEIRKLKTPREAKIYGRQLELRPDWDEIKVQVMLFLIRQKFNLKTALAVQLQETKGQELIEGNTWGDTFWGVCDGEGQNMLGKILMQVREENNAHR